MSMLTSMGMDEDMDMDIDVDIVVEIEMGTDVEIDMDAVRPARYETAVPAVVVVIAFSIICLSLMFEPPLCRGACLRP